MKKYIVFTIIGMIILFSLGCKQEEADFPVLEIKLLKGNELFVNENSELEYELKITSDLLPFNCDIKLNNSFSSTDLLDTTLQSNIFIFKCSNLNPERLSCEAFIQFIITQNDGKSDTVIREIRLEHYDPVDAFDKWENLLFPVNFADITQDCYFALPENSNYSEAIQYQKSIEFGYLYSDEYGCVIAAPDDENLITCQNGTEQWETKNSTKFIRNNEIDFNDISQYTWIDGYYYLKIAIDENFQNEEGDSNVTNITEGDIIALKINDHCGILRINAFDTNTKSLSFEIIYGYPID